MKKQLFNKDFTLVIIGQIISLFGNAILRFALPLYLLRETGSATLFGIVTACSFLPMIVLSFLGGVLADRVNKRNIMVILDFLTATIIIILYFAIGELPIVPLFIVVLMLLYGISGSYQPTVQASIPVLVSNENILVAGAVVNQIGALAGLLGPIVGGVLYGNFGLVPILLISILCFLVSAVMEIFIKIPFEKRRDGNGIGTIIKEDLYSSIDYIKNKKPTLAKIIATVAVFNLVLSAMLVVGTPILIIDILKMSDQALGFAQGALALGGLTGGILTAVLSKKLNLANSYRMLLLCSLLVFVMAIPLVLQMTSITSYIIIAITNFGIMGLATMFSVQMLAAVQTETPPELVGKIIALMMSISMCAQPLGQALYGFIFDLCSSYIGVILVAVAIISALISLVSKKAFSQI